MIVEVKFVGPLFQTGVAQQALRRALRGAIEETIDKGNERLMQVLRLRPAGVYLSVEEAGRGKASTGHYRRSIHQEMKSDTMGIISDGGVIYGPWLEGTSSRNQSTRFKGYSSFRKTAQWLQKEQVPKILQAHAKKLIRDLT